jgi:hypothetical protein
MVSILEEGLNSVETAFRAIEAAVCSHCGTLDLARR